jgi:hypothetical protein
MSGSHFVFQVAALSKRRLRLIRFAAPLRCALNLLSTLTQVGGGGSEQQGSAFS